MIKQTESIIREAFKPLFQIAFLLFYTIPEWHYSEESFFSCLGHSTALYYAVVSLVVIVEYIYERIKNRKIS